MNEASAQQEEEEEGGWVGGWMGDWILSSLTQAAAKEVVKA